MDILLDDIVKKLSLRVIGGLSKKITVSGVGSLTGATDTQLSFIASSGYLKYLKTTKACAVIMDYEALKNELPQETNFIILDAKNPYLLFAKLTQLFYRKDNIDEAARNNYFNRTYIDESAVIGENSILSPGSFADKGVIIGRNCSIMANVSIGKNVKIGDNVLIYPNVSVYDNSIIGNNCIIHAGAVIGSDGFGYARDKAGYVKIIHSGYVVIEDDVELGANVTVDRGAVDFTRIGRGTKIDNLVQIAHNVIVGSNCAIAAQTGIAGSSTIGDNAVIGGQVGIAGHISIGNNVTIAAQSGVAHSITDNSIVSGSPAIPIKDWRGSAVLFKKLPELFKRVRDIEKNKELKND